MTIFPLVFPLPIKQHWTQNQHLVIVHTLLLNNQIALENQDSVEIVYSSQSTAKNLRERIMNHYLKCL